MKVGLAGTGWRAQMYVRVMKALGEEFEVSAVYVHSESSREREEKNFPGKVYTDYDEFLATKPDCVVFMLKYGAALPFAEKAMEQGIPVLCETPPAATVEELQAWYQAKEKYNGKVQVAEQYCFQPYYQALIHMIDQGKLGTISNLDISQAHDYHGMSVMRRLLGTGMENCRITARTYDFPVNYHCGREGLHKGEKTIVDTRKRAEFVFPDGKVGFFDFAGEQYFFREQGLPEKINLHCFAPAGANSTRFSCIQPGLLQKARRIFARKRLLFCKKDAMISKNSTQDPCNAGFVHR